MLFVDYKGGGWVTGCKDNMVVAEAGVKAVRASLVAQW